MAGEGGDTALASVPAKQMQAEEAAMADSKANEESNPIKEAEMQALADFKRAIAAAATAGEFSSLSSSKKIDANKEGAVDDDSGKKEAGEQVSLWGVQLLDGSEGADVVLLKFLRAREFKTDQALKMLKNTVHWRRRFGCDEDDQGKGLMDEKFDAGINSTGFYYAVDKGGLPVCYNVIDSGIYNECLEGKDRSQKLEKLLRWRVQLIEKGLKLLDFNRHGGVSSIIQVVDLKQFSMKKEASRAALSDTIQLLSDNYPELVSKLIFINVPWYYDALYRVISPFVTQRTKNKISVATKGRTSEALFKLISPDNVPPQYGGLGKKNEELFEDVKAPVSESCVKAGSMLLIEIQVNEGDEVTWELSVSGWDVNYGAEFKPSSEGGYTIIVEKTRKIEAQEDEVVCNSFKNSSAGSLLLTIDNSASKKRKPVVYRYFVKG